MSVKWTVECDECVSIVHDGRKIICQDCYEQVCKDVAEAQRQRDDLQDEVDKKKREIIDLETETDKLQADLRDAESRRDSGEI